MGQPPACGTNIASPCATGCNSSNGWFGNWFARPANTAPVSMSGDSFGYVEGTSYYGNGSIQNPTMAPGTIAPAQIVQPSSELYGSGVGNMINPPAIGPFDGS